MTYLLLPSRVAYPRGFHQFKNKRFIVSGESVNKAAIGIYRKAIAERKRRGEREEGERVKERKRGMIKNENDCSTQEEVGDRNASKVLRFFILHGK